MFSVCVYLLEGGQLDLRPEQPPLPYWIWGAGCLGLRPGWPSTILEGGCSGLRLRSPLFCVKSARAAEAGGGALRPLTPRISDGTIFFCRQSTHQ